MTKKKMKKLVFPASGILFLLTIIIAPVCADSGISLSNGQTVYVSVYTHIYSGLKGRPFELGATLSIRNTDPKHPITLVSVKFYDTEGKLLKEYLGEPIRLNALVSTRYVLKEGESGGGSGANFLVTWKSEKKVNPPIIETIMIGTRSGQGISFVSQGQEIQDQ
jgi:hypothetical protein